MKRPNIGMRAYVYYNGALRECEVKYGSAYMRNGKFKRLLGLSIAGCGVHRFGDAEIPDLYLSEDDYKNGKKAESFSPANVHKVLKDTVGEYTISSDRPWCVTRFKWENGRPKAKTFKLPATVVFDRKGTRFAVKPDFGEYRYATVEQALKDNPEVVKFATQTITFKEEDCVL